MDMASLWSTRVGADIITDFIQSEDVIDLQAMDAIRTNVNPNDSFTFVTGAFTNVAGQLRALVVGTTTFVELDVTGDGQADAILRLNGIYDLNASDFLL